MFTMPAIHHFSVKAKDSSPATMHLNALNGSSNVLGYSDPDSSSCPCRSGVFGGIIGVSLSENHPYRPQDCGTTFHETSQPSQKTHTFAVSSSMPLPSPNQDKPGSRYGDSFALLRDTETTSPEEARRRSFDLDVVSAASHRRYEDRSLSLDALVLGPFSKFGRRVEDTIDERSLASDLAELSLIEASSDTSKSPSLFHDLKSNQAKSRGKKAHIKDSSMSDKTSRLLDKVKDNRKDHNSNFKYYQPRSGNTHEESDENVKPSKLATSQHILHCLTDHSSQEKPS